jgi:hypothetical protein
LVGPGLLPDIVGRAAMRPRAHERKAGISMLILRFLLSSTFIQQSEDHFHKFKQYIEFSISQMTSYDYNREILRMPFRILKMN